MHDFQGYFPGLSRTLCFNFQDFPGPKWFSRNFQVLEISRKKSRTFQEAWEPCNKFWGLCTYALHTIWQREAKCCMVMKLDEIIFFYVGWPRRGPGQNLVTEMLTRDLSAVANLVDIATDTAIFPTPCILRPRWRGSPWNWISARSWGQKNWSDGLPGRTISLTLSSAMWIQCTNVTDGRTDTGRQQRPRLRIASCG